MINYPPVNDLEEKAGCRYMLVTSVAKRARQLLSEPETLENRKAVSAAVEELYDGKLILSVQEEQL